MLPEKWILTVQDKEKDFVITSFFNELLNTNEKSSDLEITYNQDGDFNYVLRTGFDINQFNYTLITYEQFLENRKYIKYLHGKLNTYTPDLDNNYLIETFKKLKIK